MKLSNRKLANPFIYQGYESPEYFCDREAETKTLISHLKNGRNVTLISPRRIGKTGLIKNTFYHLDKEEKDLLISCYLVSYTITFFVLQLCCNGKDTTIY